MKVSRLAISTGPDSQSSLESYLTYILPTKEIIQDFYSDRDFTLIVSNSGELWEIGNFLSPNENSFEYHSLSFRLSIVSITSNGTCTLLLSNHGKVYGWGRSHTGILEPGICSNPTLIPWLTMKKVCQLSISQNYAGCIDDQGSGYIWGTYVNLDLEKSLHQINDNKNFTCKEIICKEQFFVICTDGGFVYYNGSLGNHSRKINKELEGFEELEELCVLQISAGENFIAVLTENNEIFVFDGCNQLIKLPVHSKIENIVANKESLVGLGIGTIHKWSDFGTTKKQFYKNYCPLKEWVGKVYSINEKFEIYNIRAMNHLYGLVINSEASDRIEAKLVKLLDSEESKKTFKRSIEPDIHNFSLLLRIIEKLRKKLTIFAFAKVHLEYGHKTRANFVKDHSKLPYVLVEVVHKKINRGLIAGFSAIKQEIQVQDFIARERIKKIRANNQYKQEKTMTLLRILSGIHSRVASQLCKFVFLSLKTHQFHSEHIQKHLISLFALTRKVNLRHFLCKWSHKARNYLKFSEKIQILSKTIKSKRIQQGFSAILSQAEYKSFIFKAQKEHLAKAGRILISKRRRVSFNIWKAGYLKYKAQQERVFKKYQLSVKLGCKYLFPVIEYHLSTYWSIFQLNSFSQVKSRYKHFAQFLHYFIKKKLTGFWALSFLRISGTSASLTISPEESQYSYNPHLRDDSNLINSSLVSSLNMLINSHKKKVSSCMGSPKIPNLSLNESNSRGKISSSQSTFRPPWKPASNPNSRGNTPKADNKKRKSFNGEANRCLRSLNILPIKKKLIQKKPNKPSKIDGIRIEVGLGNFVRAIENIRFRLKFRCFSSIKFIFN